MISVIIPVYNAEPYLRRCLDSVLRSSYQEFELILVNDGSTDESPAICAEYAARDSRIVLLSQENRGVSAARNWALDVCRGEWVVFVDADDQISPAFLGLIAREEYQDQDLILFDLAESAEDFAAAAPPPETLYFGREAMPELLRSLLQRRQLVPGRNLDLLTPAAKAYRKAFLDRYSIRFCPTLFFGEDALFNAECYAKAEHCAYTPIPVYYYRFHADSASHRLNPKTPEAHVELLQKLRAVLEENRLFSTLEKEYDTYALGTLYYVLVWSVFSPDSTSSYGEKMRLCRKLRNMPLYREALQHSFRCGNLVMRTMSLLFYMRLYPAVGLFAALWGACLTRKKRG